MHSLLTGCLLHAARGLFCMQRVGYSVFKSVCNTWAVLHAVLYAEPPSRGQWRGGRLHHVLSRATDGIVQTVVCGRDGS